MRLLLLSAVLALAACGADEPVTTIDGIDPVQTDGDLAPDATVQPGGDLAPEASTAPEPPLAPEQTLQPDSTGG